MITRAKRLLQVSALLVILVATNASSSADQIRQESSKQAGQIVQDPRARRFYLSTCLVMFARKIVGHADGTRPLCSCIPT